MNAPLARRLAERFLELAPFQRRAFYEKLRNDGQSFQQFPIVPRLKSQSWLSPMHRPVNGFCGAWNPVAPPIT